MEFDNHVALPDDDGSGKLGERLDSGTDNVGETDNLGETGNVGDSEAKSKRTMKPLPPELENFPPEKINEIHCAVEVYKQGSETLEKSLAQYVDISITTDGVISTRRVDLHKDLNLCQLRRFCKRLGIKQTGSSTKHGCRRAIAHHKDYHIELSKHGLHPQTTETLTRNTLMRMVNVVFNSHFIDRFIRLNDLKRRVDHETGQMVKDFLRTPPFATTISETTTMDNC
jgi:hypothetical protein